MRRFLPKFTRPLKALIQADLMHSSTEVFHAIYSFFKHNLGSLSGVVKGVGVKMISVRTSTDRT